MAKNLVIVESPAKVKTIKKFLGKNYEVMASNGHVRDLPKSQLGVDVDNDFEPKYITIRGKGDILASLRKEAKKADRVYLATDPDREGEAISWHLITALKLQDKEVLRISFNEITKNAVKESLKHPGKINTDLVDAQQARRVLDRLVGYQISPLLWAKVKRGLSAGRVQSAALGIVCKREEEINAFIPKEYWTVDAILDAEGEKKPLIARFYGDRDKKIEIENEDDAKKIEEEAKKNTFAVEETKKSTRKKKPPLPFTTSTLQQDAARKLNFTPQKTMRVAQQLYEGVAVKGWGNGGLITYLRTDSVRISDEAKTVAAEYISQAFGEEFVNDKEISKKGSGKIQDAHEAIRPTDINLLPEKAKDSLSRDQYRLYQLIWKRFTASQMAHSQTQTISIKISSGKYIYTVSASKVVFQGYLKVYSDDDGKKDNANVILNSIGKDTSLLLSDVEKTQHFTKAPDHYTEGSLVRTMEELGIGRPSTYAPTITTLLSRRYLLKEEKNLYVTEIGDAVNGIMQESFPEIMDENFTAGMEEELDEVEQGKRAWKDVVRVFYPPFEAELKVAEEELEKIEIRDEETDVECENCGRKMVIKYGPHGKFLACPGFPDCKNTKPYQEKAGVSCPSCGKEILIKKTKKGRRYYGCEGYPDCEFMSWQKPSAEKCPVCGSYMLEKGKKLACSDASCGYVREIS